MTPFYHYQSTRRTRFWHIRDDEREPFSITKVGAWPTTLEKLLIESLKIAPVYSFCCIVFWASTVVVSPACVIKFILNPCRLFHSVGFDGSLPDS